MIFGPAVGAEIGTTSPALRRGKSEYPLGWPMPAREGAHHQLAIPDEPVEQFQVQRCAPRWICFEVQHLSIETVAFITLSTAQSGQL